MASRHRTLTYAQALYEATRQERTARVQLTSRQNSWGKGVTDTDWVYGYNAWTAPLADAPRLARTG